MTVVVGNGTHVDGLYRLLLDPPFDHNFLTLHGNVSIKRSIVNEKCSMLWHKRLGHISIERIRRLNDGVLEALDFSIFGFCVDCIKGKQTKKTKKGAGWSFEILEIMHTGMYGFFPTSCLNSKKYFISFIRNICIYT